MKTITVPDFILRLKALTSSEKLFISYVLTNQGSTDETNKELATELGLTAYGFRSLLKDLNKKVDFLITNVENHNYRTITIDLNKFCDYLNFRAI